MLASLALHKSWIVFVGTFFLGESVVLAASALAAHGSWSWQAVAGWALLGTVVSDTVWFRSSAAGLSRWTAADQRRRLDDAGRRLERLTGDRPHRALLVVKFMYGTRIASIVYMALRRVPVRTFVIFDTAGTMVWLAVMIPVGWAIGTGLEQAGARLREVEWVILALILVAVGVKGLMQWQRTRRS